ncbi:hypothetical protein PLICRDRAFT_407589 [Plicaturopsis crispa FD-325 SS-3]|nr:hypothetical protein PLICRDRAFT_407589 [Plicaturopsis crispa FD-325 SS-3]
MSPSDSPDTSLDERSFQIHCGRCGVAIQNGPEISRTSDPWFQCACKTPVVKYGETSSSYYLSYPARVKEKRRRASPEQVAALESAYSNNAFPDSTERVALAERLCMSARSVQI